MFSYVHGARVPERLNAVEAELKHGRSENPPRHSKRARFSAPRSGAKRDWFGNPTAASTMHPTRSDPVLTVH